MEETLFVGKTRCFFLFTVLKISYVLDPNLPAPTPQNTDQVKAERTKHRLYDLFTSESSPKEIWKALEYKYNTEKQGVDKFLIMKYFEFLMVENVSIMDQVHEL
ncbi:hypothetical protein MANES_03G053732v8 [Manihot esculenta]|uniref:Uncharacterized protein n=1 Tax=Manihot esculenta TaxID=3983 RepID=A0ACB7I062_MANES|nr:hypothetical protein MANES_03G053732v8 [Manihot esculenta]